MRFQVGIAPRAAGSPVVVLQRDVQILLTIKIACIAAHAALQPVIFLIVTRKTRKAVVIGWTGRRDAR